MPVIQMNHNKKIPHHLKRKQKRSVIQLRSLLQIDVCITFITYTFKHIMTSNIHDMRKSRK